MRDLRGNHQGGRRKVSGVEIEAEGSRSFCDIRGFGGGGAGMEDGWLQGPRLRPRGEGSQEGGKPSGRNRSPSEAGDSLGRPGASTRAGPGAHQRSGLLLVGTLGKRHWRFSWWSSG